MDETLKPNSHRYREESAKENAEKKVEKVVNAPAKTKKKSELKKFSDVFIAEDIKNVKNYVFMDIIVPAIKDAIIDVVTDGISMMFGRGKSGKRPSSSSGYVSYRDCAKRRDEAPSRRERSSRFDYDEIIFNSRGDAEAVLDGLEAIIAKYGVATVADLYDLADLTAPYTANRYGWSSLRTAEVTRERGGYSLDLPKAMPID